MIDKGRLRRFHIARANLVRRGEWSGEKEHELREALGIEERPRVSLAAAVRGR